VRRPNPPAPAKAPAVSSSPAWWTKARVRQAALGVGLLQLVFAAFAMASSGYFADDYLFFVTNRAGGFGVGQLTGSVYGSLIPGFQLGNSMLASFQPIPRWPGIVFPLLMFALALFVFYRLLEFLLGARPLLVVLLALTGFSTVLATSLVWWTAALNSLPAVICDVLALDGLARHAATGKVRHLVVSVVAFAVGVGFYDGSGSFALALVVFTALYLVDRTDWRHFAQGFLRRWWVWVGYALPLALNFEWRAAHPAEYTLPPLPSASDALHFVGIGWGEGFVPAILGIPLYDIYGHGARTLVVTAGQCLFWGLVAFTIWRRRQAWRAWAVFAASFLGIEIVVAIGRGGYGESSSINTVYWTVQPFILALAAGLAWRPSCLEELGLPAPDPPRRLPGGWPRLPARQGVGVGAAAAVALVALGLHATWISPSREQGAQNHGYNDTLASSWSRVERAEPRAFVWNIRGPNFLLPFLLGYDRVATTSGYLMNLRIDATSGPGYIPTASGELVPATASVVSRAMVSAGTSACIGPQRSSRILRVPLGTVVPSGNWFLRMHYARSSGFSTSLNRTTVRVEPGSGVLLVPDEGSIGSATLSVTVPRGASLCVTRADFEAPVPATGDLPRR
jgi:hypothetical protein